MSQQRAAKIDSILARLLQWRHSMFWTLVPTMFVASCATAACLIVFATFGEDTRLRTTLEPALLARDFAQALRVAAPLLLTVDGRLADSCADTLYVLSERILSKAMADRTGDANVNSFYQAERAGRLAVSLRMPDGRTCVSANEEVPLLADLRSQMDAASARARSGATGAATGNIVERPDGWTSVVAVAATQAGGPVLAAGVNILSPLAKLKQPRSIFRPLALFILSINTLAALVLVVLLIRRIRRADQAAAAWALGQLDARINDGRQDEFSRLAHKFDVMADAMAGVIEVKQALAAADERSRLARDLHDSAKQRAFALNLQLSAALAVVPQATPGVRLVEAALLLTTQLQEDLANVIRRLPAPSIVQSGLRNALNVAIDAMLAGSRIQWTLALDAQDDRDLTGAPEVAHQLFLMTIESVANALKHAACTQCDIRGERAGGRFTWRITDNGTGTCIEARGVTGMGVANLKLRAAALDGGTLDIRAGESSGTVITVSFRLKESI